MTAAAIIADVRRAIALLAELDDPAATRTAEVLTRWLAGEAFETAAGLAPGWRNALQMFARNAALAELVSLHPELDVSAIARLITAGIERAARTHGVRPDGEAGLMRDLSRLEKRPRERTWRTAIAEIRGQRNARFGHDLPAPSAKLRR